MFRAIVIGLVVVLICSATVHAGVVIETVTVGNPGNPGDTRYPFPPVASFGGVAYAYNIGTFEVTAGQYRDFLNAVAGGDTYGLYSTNMGDPSGCNIQRTGSSGSYSYSVAGDWAERPVNYVSWGDAARFCNWLHNGQPSGVQNDATTEDGAYDLNGAMNDWELINIQRMEDATWVIPSEDEWYKAAYHFNDGVTGNYWDYPTESDTAPTSEAPPGTDITNGSANYSWSWNDWAIGSPYYRTEVGAYDAKPSDSPYGTFDQGGNVWEWNEAILFNAVRGLRGGAFSTPDVSLLAAFRGDHGQTHEVSNVGFRVAEVPEPATIVLVAFGSLVLLHRRRG